MKNLEIRIDLAEKEPMLDIVFSVREYLTDTAWWLNQQRETWLKMLLTENDKTAIEFIKNQARPFSKALKEVLKIVDYLDKKALEHNIDMEDLYSDNGEKFDKLDELFKGIEKRIGVKDNDDI